MTTLAIILALAAEHFLPEQENYRSYDWFRFYREWVQEQPWGAWVDEGALGIIALLLPPLLILGLLQYLLQDMLAGIPELLFAIAILLYSLGPRDLDRQVTEFIDAWDSGDEDKAKEIASDLVATESSNAEYGRNLARAILEHACYRIFGVLFWFLLLGPLGAILYRLSHQLNTTDADNEAFRSDLHHLLEILNWLPARLTAATFAVAGDFQGAIIGWRGDDEAEPDGPLEKSAGEILADTGLGAAGLGATYEGKVLEDHMPSQAAEAAMALAWRSVITWVALLVLTNISSWL